MIYLYFWIYHSCYNFYQLTLFLSLSYSVIPIVCIICSMNVVLGFLSVFIHLTFILYIQSNMNSFSLQLSVSVLLFLSLLYDKLLHRCLFQNTVPFFDNIKFQNISPPSVFVYMYVCRNRCCATFVYSFLDLKHMFFSVRTQNIKYYSI